MKPLRYLASLSLFLAFSTVGCSRPSAAPKSQEQTAKASPQPAAPAPSSATPTPGKSTATDQSISANIGDPAAFRNIMTALQLAVEKHDAATVASLVSFPIDINPRKKDTIRIRTPEDFVASYDRIITPHISDIIRDQKYEELFVNYQGAMFGSGEVWIAGICKDRECKQSEPKIRTIQNTSGHTVRP